MERFYNELGGTVIRPGEDLMENADIKEPRFICQADHPIGSQAHKINPGSEVEHDQVTPIRTIP